MEKQELLKEIAKLETQQDFLMTELSSLDLMLREIGFQEGLTTLKQAACVIRGGGKVKFMESNEALLKKIAQLESENDQLFAELRYIDELMRQAGFSDGLETVKATARELIANRDNEGEDQQEAA